MKNKKNTKNKINEGKFKTTHVDVTFTLHLFILRGDDIYYSQVYPLILFPTKLKSK